jgi:hypothetical protein
MAADDATPAPTEATPLFGRTGGRYLPTDMSSSPWGDALVGGAMISALLAHAVEAEAARLPTESDRAPLQPARLTVDLVRPVPRAPIAVEAAVVRAGRRLAAIDAAMRVDGRLVARARSLWLRPSQEPPGRIANAPESAFPGPDAFATDSPREGRPWPDPWDRRTVRPRGGDLPAVTWIRLASPLVVGVAASPFVRAAAAADFANPQGNQGSAGLQFVNADISLTVHRLPHGEWMLAAAVARGSEAGLAFASCSLADEEGRFGAATVASLASARAR